MLKLFVSHFCVLLSLKQISRERFTNLTAVSFFSNEKTLDPFINRAEK